MKKIMFAVLFAAAACGAAKSSANRSALAECTYSVPDTASQDQIQQVIDDAESGALDVCGDLLSADVRASEHHAVLESIEPDRPNAAMLLRFTIFPGNAPVNTP